MYFVARRTELRGLRAHERLQKGAPVRLRVYAHEEIVKRADYGIVAGRQLVQLRVLQNKIALSHRALHLHDAVTHQAAQSRFCFRPIHDFLDGLIKKPAEEQRRIVAARAPL